MHPLLAEARRIAPNLSSGIAVVYFLRLRSEAVYIGSSTDLNQQLEDHLSGRASRITRLDPPIALLRIESQATAAAARAREAQLKRWTHAKKEALIRGDLIELHKMSEARKLF